MLIGYRKFVVVMTVIVFIFIATMVGKVSGETASVTLGGIATAFAGIEVAKQKFLK